MKGPEIINLYVRKIDDELSALVYYSSHEESVPLGITIWHNDLEFLTPDETAHVRASISAAGELKVLAVYPLSSEEKVTEEKWWVRDIDHFEVTPIPYKEEAMSDYYISPEARLVFNTAFGMSQNNPSRAVKIMMIGKSGLGKTTLPKLFAERAGMGFMRMNCASIRDPEEWFGFREAREGSTVFIKSHFAQAIEQGNMVVVLDEFNRLEPWLHNTLFPLLDEDGRTVVHDQEFRIGLNVIVVGTINTGYRYTGTFELDEALGNRFHLFLELVPPPPPKEAEVLISRHGIQADFAHKIVKAATLLREKEVNCSTRSTLDIAALVMGGMTLREAFEYVVVKRIPEDVGGVNLRKSIVDIINVQLGNLKPRRVEEDIFGGEGVVEKVTNQEPKIAPSAEGIKVQLALFHDKSEFFPALNIIKHLRSVYWEGESLTLSAANQMVKDLVAGKVVSGTISFYDGEDAFNIGLFSESLSSLGIQLSVMAVA